MTAKVGQNFGCWGRIDTVRDDIVTIGDCVILGAASAIITHCPISFYNGKPFEIRIGNNVYIGVSCIILPGANIGDNVMIGAGSVVAGTIPPNSVAVGNPCRAFRELAPIEIKRLRLMAEQGKVGDGKEPEGM
jgi:acetyltransferase-like isoleucine patch superfamily enzyme